MLSWTQGWVGSLSWDRFASPSTLASNGQSHLQSSRRAVGIWYFFPRVVFSNSVGPLFLKEQSLSRQP